MNRSTQAVYEQAQLSIVCAYVWLVWRCYWWLSWLLCPVNINQNRTTHTRIHIHISNPPGYFDKIWRRETYMLNMELRNSADAVRMFEPRWREDVSVWHSLVVVLFAKSMFYRSFRYQRKTVEVDCVVFHSQCNSPAVPAIAEIILRSEFITHRAKTSATAFTSAVSPQTSGFLHHLLHQSTPTSTSIAPSLLIENK